MSEKLNLDKNGQWSLEKRCWEGYEPTPGKKAYEKGSCRPKKDKVEKSNYGKIKDLDGKTTSQYSQTDNITRKQNRTGEEVEGVGRNKAVHEYSSAVQGSAKSQAAREAQKYKKLNQKQPVKQFSPEEIAEMNAKLKMKKADVAPEKSNNRKTYLKEFKKSLASDDVDLIFWNDASVDLLCGEDVASDYIGELTKYLSDQGYDLIEKKEWSPKAKHKSKSGGLTQEGVESYRRANPGSKLQTAVTEDSPKGKRAKRRRSFCARNKGQIDMHNIDCSKTPEKRACLARKKWKCKN